MSGSRRNLRSDKDVNAQMQRQDDTPGKSNRSASKITLSQNTSDGTDGSSAGLDRRSSKTLRPHKSRELDNDITKHNLPADNDNSRLDPQHLFDDTPRKSSRTPSKISLLQNTPDRKDQSFTELDRQSSRSLRSRKSRELANDLITHDFPVDNNNSLLNTSNVINNSSFDPQHLYGLDNPENTLPDTKDKENVDKESRNKEQSIVFKIVKKANIYWICFGFSIFMWLSLIGWMITINALIHGKLESSSLEKFGKKELGLKQLGERLSKLEKGNMLCNAQSYQKIFLDDKAAVKGNGGDLLKLITIQIEQALQRWDADKIGMPDYALESAGGQIHSAYHSPTFSNGAPQFLVFGIPMWYEVRTPRVIIQPGNTPGECWAFRGKEGYVVIKHMSASLSQFGDNSIPSAPKDFSVWGWRDAHGKEKTKLGEYVYDHVGSALQNFPVESLCTVVNLHDQLKDDCLGGYFNPNSEFAFMARWNFGQVSPLSNFRFVELRVHSNYGNPSYTCLYRFRVHGDPYKHSNSEK